MALESPTPSPRNDATMSILKNGNPHGDHHKIREGREKMPDIAKQPQAPENPRVAKVKGPLDPEDIRPTILRDCPRSGPGPGGLRYRHLQVTMSVPEVEDIVAFVKTVFSSDSLRDLPGTLVQYSRCYERRSVEWHAVIYSGDSVE